MATKKITELVEIISAANDDVLPIVDISTDITNKIKVENLPISTSVQTALNGKENTIGYTTENVANKSTSVTTDQASNTKYPSVKAVYDWAVGLFATISQLATKQDTLVSGTNIKTINSTSILGTGNISIQANPSGVAGAIQFSDGSAFASDATNLFWDNSNQRLGVGTNAPTGRIGVGNDEGLHFGSRGYISGNPALNGIYLRSGTGTFGVGASGNEYTMTVGGGLVGMGISTATPTARLQVRGSGSTSATTALLVQNSSGTTALTVKDNGELIATGNVILGSSGSNVTFNQGFNNQFIQNRLSFYGVSTNIRGTNLGGQGLIISKATGLSDLYPTALLAIDSTTQGFLPPRMTTTQKNAISSPAAGLQVYDTTLNQMSYYNGTSWVNF